MARILDSATSAKQKYITPDFNSGVMYFNAFYYLFWCGSTKQTSALKNWMRW